MMIKFIEILNGCAKGLLIALNVFCMLFAILSFGFAVVDTRILKQYGEEHAIGTLAGDVVIIAVSFLLICVAVLGCVGTVKENPKILYLYAGLIMILVILELLVGIFVGVQRWSLELEVTDWLRDDFFKNCTGEALTMHDKNWDELQSDYECCGLNGPEDYLAIHRPISLSCCPRAYRVRDEDARQQLYKACIQSQDYFKDGCEEEILDVLQSAVDNLLGVAVTSFWFEAGGLFLAMWLANNLRNSVKQYKHTVKY